MADLYHRPALGALACIHPHFLAKYERPRTLLKRWGDTAAYTSSTVASLLLRRLWMCIQYLYQ